MSIPELPDDAWAHIVYKARINPSLLSLTRCTRNATFKLIERAYSLNRLQAIAFCKAVYLEQDVFLTGGAGTGKSFVAHAIVDRICRALGNTSCVAVVAPTGAAAQCASTKHVTATTIHSLFNVQRVRRRPEDPPVIGSQKPTLDELAFQCSFLDAEIEPSQTVGLETSVCDTFVRKRLCELNCLLIDEVSMVRVRHRTLGGP